MVTYQLYMMVARLQQEVEIVKIHYNSGLE